MTVDIPPAEAERRVVHLVDHMRQRGALEGGGGGGHSGGVPPDLTERVVRLEAGLEALKATVDTQNAKIDKIGEGIEALTAAVKANQAVFEVKFAELTGNVNTRIANLESTLGQRISAVEGQLKHIPTIWTMLLGQLGACIVVAGLVFTIIKFAK
jgi:hypothetical protein